MKEIVSKDWIIDRWRSNKKLISNIIAAFVIKGTGLIVNLLALPLYIHYFGNQTVLGVWFTIVTMVGWILNFDIGVGNGLRNKLTIALSHKDYDNGKRLISSSYFVMGVLTLVLLVIAQLLCKTIRWNELLNISTSVIDASVLLKCITILVGSVFGCFFFQIVRAQIYALQLSSVNNFLHMITSLLMVVVVYFLPTNLPIEQKLINITIANSVILNLPYLVATIIVHKYTILRNCAPSLKFISVSAAKSVLGLGITFFAVQLLHMIISVSNEWFISVFYNPANCVDYQIYFRFFSLMGTLIMLALTPLWSAITKAYAEKRYIWVYNLNKYLSLIALGAIVIQCLVLLILQPLVDLWLGEKSIQINYLTASFFLMYSVEMIWISVQSTIVAGLGKLNLQVILYSVAVLLKVLIIVLSSRFFPDSWQIVVLATGIGLLPYCIVQPFFVSKLLKRNLSY